MSKQFGGAAVREMDLQVKLMTRPDQAYARPALVDAIYGVMARRTCNY